MKKTKTIFVFFIVLIELLVGYREIRAKIPLDLISENQQTNLDPNACKIHIRLFINDEEQNINGIETLEINSEDQPVEINRIDKNVVIIGSLGDKCSFHFTQGKIEVSFEDVRTSLLKYSGELGIGLITRTELLNKNVSLVKNKVKQIGEFSSYDSARSVIVESWKHKSEEEKEKISRAVFYYFIPDDFEPPQIEVVHYFELVKE